MKGSEEKHDKLIDIVEKELFNRGIYLTQKRISFNNGREDGEIDLPAYKSHYAFVFEMKCNNNRKNYKKALQQLNKERELFSHSDYRLFKFYVYYEKGKPSYHWIHDSGMTGKHL